MIRIIWGHRMIWVAPLTIVATFVCLDIAYGGKPATAPFIYNPNR